jgi:hypothetical protein
MNNEETFCSCSYGTVPLAVIRLRPVAYAATVFAAVFGVCTQRNPVWAKLVSGLTFMRALGR